MTDIPKRKRTRLKDYDYSKPGAYFITICTHRKQHLFGAIQNDAMHLSFMGKIATQEIQHLEIRYPNIRVNRYVVMPNHIHLLLTILESEGMNPFPTQRNSISNIIGSFKAGISRKVGNAFMRSEKVPIWQKSFHDHIIRNQNDYEKIWNYIDTNVLKWTLDCFYNENRSEKNGL